MSEKVSPQPPSSRASLPVILSVILAAGVLIANIAVLALQSSRFQAMAGRLESLEHEVFLYRIERTSVYGDGFGFNALLEALMEWAPKLQSADHSNAEYEGIQKRVNNLVQAIGRMPDAFAQVKRLLDDPRQHDAESDEIRMSLIRAAQIADLAGSEDILTALLIDADDTYSGRIRTFAARELARGDRERAGEILQRILTTEHASGEVRTRGQRVRERPKPYFYKFIDIFVNTQHPQVESALMQVLARRKDHDHITIQTTVIALGRMKSRAGAKMIQGMYFTPPPGQVANPLFRMKCLTAVMDTLGADATEFFREVERRETDRGIRKKLDEYQKIVH